MEAPLISLVTVTYNAAATLPSTLESVAEQLFTDYEHVIIDGASTDGTLAIAAGRPRTRILSEPDGGIYYAMNKAFDICRGKYLLFLNAGDMFTGPGTLGSYADAILSCAGSQPKVVYGDTQLVNKSGIITGPRHLSAPQILTADSFRQGMLVCHQAFMVRRDVAPLYNTDYRFSADYDWCLRILQETTPDECVNLHQNTILYLDEGMTTRNHRASLLERFTIMRRHFGLAPTLGAHCGFLLRSLKRKILLDHNHGKH